MDDIDYGGGDDGYDAPYQFSSCPFSLLSILDVLIWLASRWSDSKRFGAILFVLQCERLFAVCIFLSFFTLTLGVTYCLSVCLFVRYAKLLVRDGSNSITMDDLFPSTTNTLKSEVARAFQHILSKSIVSFNKKQSDKFYHVALASREMVTLEQRTPYELIHIEFTD